MLILDHPFTWECSIENQKFIDSSVYQLWLVDELVGVAEYLLRVVDMEMVLSGTDANCDARFFGRGMILVPFSNQHQVAIQSR